MRKKLVDKFSGHTSLPIEVAEVAAALVEFGFQDHIYFSPEDTDPGKLRGVYYQYTTSPGVYVPPDLKTLIVYSSNLSVPWQRMVCCKEMVHACDAHIEKTDTPEEVEELLITLLGPLSTEDYGLADLMAAVDKVALYQALGILFPLAAREEAVAAIQQGSKTQDQIVEWSNLPEDLVGLVLKDSWPELFATITNC